MLYRIAADGVLVLHLAFILFVVFGGFVILRYPRLIWLHLPVVFWGAGIEIVGAPCPLTSMENSLLRRAGEEGYAESFIEHYFLPLIYPAGLTRNLQILMAAFVVVVNVTVYAWIHVRRQRRRHGH